MRTAPSSIQTYARLAGLGYLVIIVTGIFAEFFVRSSIIVPGDATATAANLLGAQTCSVPAFIGEVSFCLWLLAKGVRIRGEGGASSP